LLTGTLRGFERDQLVQTNPVYRALLNAESAVPHTVFLVSTSAGEVGIDLDADHLVCDLTTLDSMIQRLGRVNRRGGEGRVAQIDVLYTPPSPNNDKIESTKTPDSALRKTLEALQQLPPFTASEQSSYDARPLHLRDLLSQWPDAMLPPPRRLPLTDMLFDAWALTSGTKGLVNAPEVEPYLHGLEKERPETYVAWRTEVSLLANANLGSDTLQDWFKNCRIESQEQLREPTYQLIDELKKLAQHCGDKPAIRLASNGEAELLTVQKLANASFGELMYATIVLPVEIGGLSPEGLFDAKCDFPVVDVAETKHQRERRILHIDANTYHDAALVPASDDGVHNSEAVYVTVAQAASTIARRKRWSLTQKLLVSGSETGDEDDDIEQAFLLLLVEPKRAALENPDSAGYSKQPTVDEHCDLAEQWAKRFASALALDPLQQEAIFIAARWHDRGKDRPLWQRSIYNYGSIPFAKSGSKGMDGRLLGGYRHELGSLLEAMRDKEVSQHPEHDLILHLIAVHHGWARPHFLTNAQDERFTTDVNQQAVLEAMRRFGRLQLRFGRWGLAWLECLIRCSDVMSSLQITVQGNEIEDDGGQTNE
jgi:CRISPR-associated endonuclease/helicase Cas3